MMARTGGKLAIAHGSQFPAQGLLGDRDPELFEQPLAEIDNSPTHDAVDRRRRPALNDRGESRSMRVVEPGWLPRRFAVDQAVRAVRVELHHPIPDDLQADPAELRRFGSRRPVVNRRQRQKSSRLRTILRSLGGGPRYLRIKISPKRYGNGEPPSFANVESNQS